MNFNDLRKTFEGEVEDSLLYKIIYATDASSYKEYPESVFFPKNTNDIKLLVKYASDNNKTLIPRAAGTSLAGQVVGSGVVVDVSRHLNSILELNVKDHWIRVQPGVVLETLNQFTNSRNLFFGPETSTANRCCIGGMVGNNSCGLHSLVYGSVRDHLLEVKAVLSDGSECLFKGLTIEELNEKKLLPSLEGDIYRHVTAALDKEGDKILKAYPDSRLHRRNMGYALDQLLYSDAYDSTSSKLFNLSEIIAGSEGTLAFITEVKLNLSPLPPKEKALICVHCKTLQESFYANLVALEHKPEAVELMDQTIIELSRSNHEQSNNASFIQGTPAALLIIEIADDSRDILNIKADKIEEDLRKQDLGYFYPRIYNKDISKVWNLRKAGLGLLSGMAGDAKPVSVIEDTAVLPEKLPFYIEEFSRMLQTFHLECVYHAHISTGELHLRPILNLKKEKDLILFRKVAEETAKLVKKYNGSLSGEHGDGRLRGEFIEYMYGGEVYQLLKETKQIWDKKSIFNKGKIIDTNPMDTNLRYEIDKMEPTYNTFFDYSKEQGWLRAIEQCNGSGDCRKSTVSNGTMCPSFQATNDEKNTTRARANILRDILSNPRSEKIFDQKEVLEVLKTCLSCKACKSECPSNVDIAKYKAEFLQHYYDTCGTPLQSLLIGQFNSTQRIGSIYPNIYNFFIQNKFTSSFIKKTLSFTPHRNLPKLYKTTLLQWFKKNYYQHDKPIKTVCFFVDEFTNNLDVEIGIAFISLLRDLNYNIVIAPIKESGRTELSKGLLRKAKKIAEANVLMLNNLISEDMPMVGLEPSCLLSFRDEYLSLVSPKRQKEAVNLAKNCLLFDQFIVKEIELGNICSSSFIQDSQLIKLHGHCHQKALTSMEYSVKMLSLPLNFKVDLIPSGCCGMAGSFGYENYELSMKIGQMVLFPVVNQTDNSTLISAPGTSCRQQILDGTGRKAFHPIEILYNALIKS